MGKIAEQIEKIIKKNEYKCDEGAEVDISLAAEAIEKHILDRKPKKWDRGMEEPKWEAEDFGHNRGLKKWQDNLEEDIG